jgi:hypothetical protein
MAKMKQIPNEQWTEYFDGFTKRHLRDDLPEKVIIQLVDPELGAQVEANAIRLFGISYDAKSRAFEVLLEKLDHLVFRPKEVWVVEEDDGFVSALEIIHDDDTKEILTIHRTAALELRE